MTAKPVIEVAFTYIVDKNIANYPTPNILSCMLTHEFQCVLVVGGDVLILRTLPNH